jgi:NCS1 family nucleobase:cation symporter-1
MALTTATSSVTSYLHRRTERVKEHVKQKKTLSGWVLPKQNSTFSDEGTWSNIDSDVTPLERRTWSTWTLLGFWFSDALNAQGWEGAASIIAVGLTWSAFPSLNFSSLTVTLSSFLLF